MGRCLEDGRKVVGWSTEKKMREFRDTEEMVKKCRSQLRKKCWESTKCKSTREEHTKEEVSHLSGEWSRE